MSSPTELAGKVEGLIATLIQDITEFRAPPKHTKWMPEEWYMKRLDAMVKLADVAKKLGVERLLNDKVRDAAGGDKSTMAAEISELEIKVAAMEEAQDTMQASLGELKAMLGKVEEAVRGDGGDGSAHMDGGWADVPSEW